MKTFYLFYVLITLDGESLHRANDIAYKSLLECKAEQARHKSDDSMRFFCASPTLYPAKPTTQENHTRAGQ